MAINYDVNTGTSGRLFSQAESPTWAVGQNIQNFAAAFNAANKVQEVARQKGIAGNIAQLYAQEGKEIAPAQAPDPLTGKPGTPVQIGGKVTDEKIRDVYAAYGDTEGVDRMNEKIMQRKTKKSQAQIDLAMKQIQLAIQNKDPRVNEIIAASINNYNTDPDNIDVTGKINFNPVTRQFTVPVQAGKTVKLPDGSVIEGGLGVYQTYGVDPNTGAIMFNGVDTKERDDAMIKLQQIAVANQQKQVAAAGKMPAAIQDKFFAYSNIGSLIPEYKKAIANLPANPMEIQRQMKLPVTQRTQNVQDYISQRTILQRQISLMYNKGALSEDDVKTFTEALGPEIAGKKNLLDAANSVEKTISISKQPYIAAYGDNPIVQKMESVQGQSVQPQGGIKIKRITFRNQ